MGRENLTVEHINEMLATEHRLTPAILAASQELRNYRTLIIEARNRIISHADKQTALDNLPLGEHSRTDVVKFFENLYRYVDEVGCARLISGHLISGRPPALGMLWSCSDT